MFVEKNLANFRVHTKSKLLGRPRPSLTAEGNLDDEFGEGDKTGSSTKGSWSMSGEFRLKLYHPDNETLTIPLKYVDLMSQTQTSINNVFDNTTMFFGPKRRVSIFLRSGLGLQDSTSYAQGFLKDTSG